MHVDTYEPRLRLDPNVARRFIQVQDPDPEYDTNPKTKRALSSHHNVTIGATNDTLGSVDDNVQRRFIVHRVPTEIRAKL